MPKKTGIQSTYNQKRVWLGGSLVLGVAILAIGWFVVIGPVLTDTDSTRSQIVSVGLQNTITEAKNAKLKAQNDDVAALRDTLAAGLAELPTDSGLPAFTRQLSAQATQHMVALTSVIVGGTTAADIAAVEVAPVVDDAVAPAAVAPPATGLTQITVTVSATGLGSDLSAFLSDVQVTGPRRALVTSTQLSPADGSGASGLDATSTLNLNLTVFSAPVTPAEQAALEKLLSGS